MIKAIETAVRLLETFPEPMQEHLVAGLRHLTLEAQEELKWDEIFARSTKLWAAAQKAREEIAAGKASDMDFDKL